MEKFTLFQYPTTPSLSSTIHQTFAEQFQISLEYTLTVAHPGTLAEAVKGFREQEGMGANVTMPLKEEAFGICDQVTPRAIEAKSVNTLLWKNDQCWGDTTDGIGLVRDITQNAGASLRDKTICILGAGGAAAGILGSLLAEEPQRIFLCNRTLSRAQKLCARFDNPKVQVLDFQELSHHATVAPFDWIIKATPTCVIPPHVVKNTWTYDLAYPRIGQGAHTKFVEWSLAQGALGSMDGIGMLVEQAAESFALWHPGKSPQTSPVITYCRSLIAHP